MYLQENEAAEQPPSPAEQSFVDDDGTAYEWDPALLRFVEVGTGGGAPAVPGGPQYDEADMVFASEEEAIPAIPEEMKVGNGALSQWDFTHVMPVCKRFASSTCVQLMINAAFGAGPSR